MKRTFTQMEASPSVENPADGKIINEAVFPSAAERNSTVCEILPSAAAGAISALDQPPLSKNKLKKLKRDQEWEDNREKRKVRRKEKLQEKKLRKRTAREGAAAVNRTAVEAGMSENAQKSKEVKSQRHRQSVQVPIALIIDCGFDDLMLDTERKSLGSQLTRCYSDNYKAPYRAHLIVSSFGGHLKERFETVLSGNHRSWKGVRFLEDDFAMAASQAREWMKETKGSKIAGALATETESPQALSADLSDEGEIVYLTSDSANTLTELRPYSTYIIGGIVDKNRHKGICYKRAMDHNIKTAKLPIGDYIQMMSRCVLTTNHVTEIMLRWLEVGDWGKAFLQVIPKRKGGVLKGEAVEEDEESEPAPSNADDPKEVAEAHDIAESLVADVPNEAEDSVHPPADIIPNQS